MLDNNTVTMADVPCAKGVHALVHQIPKITLLSPFDRRESSLERLNSVAKAQG